MVACAHLDGAALAGAGIVGTPLIERRAVNGVDDACIDLPFDLSELATDAHALAHGLWYVREITVVLSPPKIVGMPF
ncbi:MAG: hypothetical protein KJS83_01420 [Xanthomonadaceae bacterium]|nr:hypothetical protein [Xanthomonadaceae bacterium]MDE2054865.1 hypothetical protein [Xanthomonadaceae bacterium]